MGIAEVAEELLEVVLVAVTALTYCVSTIMEEAHTGQDTDSDQADRYRQARYVH